MKIRTPLGILLAASLAMTGCSNNDQTTGASTDAGEVTTLRFSHFMTATDNINTEALEPWAKKIEADSNGRLKIEIYPSATLSKPGATYDATAKGSVDIGMQAQGYTAGRFPLTQIVELPGITNTAQQQSCILHKLYNDGIIKDEYEDTHLLALIGTGQGALHTVDKPIRTPADMKGLRIRQPSAVASHIIEATGAAPVGMPASDTYTSLQRGVIDGLSFTWQPIQAFRLDELINAKAMAAAKEKGDIMIDIPDPLNDPDWRGPLMEGSQHYLDEVNATGLDADNVYEKAKAASSGCMV